jgi:hypothetical protein
MVVAVVVDVLFFCTILLVFLFLLRNARVVQRMTTPGVVLESGGLRGRSIGGRAEMIAMFEGL